MSRLALPLRACVAALALASLAGASQATAPEPRGPGTSWLWLTTESVVDCTFTIKVDWAGYRRARYLEVFVTEGYDGAMLVPKRVRVRPGQNTATVTLDPLAASPSQVIFYPWAHLIDWKGSPIPSSLDFAGPALEPCAAPQ